MYWMGFSYTEAMNIPVTYKRWFIDRLRRELEPKGDKGESPPTKALAHNTPDVRQLMGRARDNVPARLRRFT